MTVAGKYPRITISASAPAHEAVACIASIVSGERGERYTQSAVLDEIMLRQVQRWLGQQGLAGDVRARLERIENKLLGGR